MWKTGCIVGLALAGLAGAADSKPRVSAIAATSLQDALAAARELLNDARAARTANDYAAARAGIAEATDRAIADCGDRDDKEVLALLLELGAFATSAGELHAAERAHRKVLDICRRTLPDDHPHLQAARGTLASTLNALRDITGARALYDKIYEVCSRTLPDDHPDLQRSREGLAVVMRQQGELAGALELFEKVHAVHSSTLPDDHPDLQRVRLNLAASLRELGDLPRTRRLEEKVLDVYTKSLPDDHPLLQAARTGHGTTLRHLGEYERARALFEKVLEVRARTLPDDHPDLQTARGNYASMLSVTGDLLAARELQEKVLAVRAASLSPDHPELQYARGNLATMDMRIGEIAGARARLEEVLSVFSRTLPDDHPDLSRARQQLAHALFLQRDFEGARELFEKVLAVRERTLPPNHPDVQQSRASLSVTLRELGQPARSKALHERVIEVYGRTLPPDHPDLLNAKINLAAALEALGDTQGAAALEEAVLAARARTLTEDALELMDARSIVAWRLARTLAASSDASASTRARCLELVDALSRAQTAAARQALLSTSGRAAEERCERMSEYFDVVLSVAAFLRVADLDRAVFALSETTRGVVLSSAALMKRAASSPRYAQLSAELRASTDELAKLVQQGTTTEDFHRVRRRREELQREMIELARDASRGELTGLEFDGDALAARLSRREAIVAYRRYRRWVFDADRATDSLCAFVVRPVAGEARATLALVELGPIAPIEAAVQSWRKAIGVGLERGSSAIAADATRPSGVEVRKLVFDPLRGALGDAERVTVVLDDVLHLVALDALPLDDAVGADRDAPRLGDRWRIDTRCTLLELLAEPKPVGATTLVALGGASFNSAPLPPSAEEVGALEEARPERVQVAALLRGSVFDGGFGPLTYTGLEAREIASLYDEKFGERAKSVVLEKRKASRASLVELAPRARFLHVATHGWFAPESIHSWNDTDPIDAKLGFSNRESGEELVAGMSPMLLCGLALAGANLPDDAVGRAPGLITADEISTLDLRGCELAVLSACDTNVGERRAGQGVASLQRAMQAAGARSVITSLWKVPDEATRELMVEFYRRLWIQNEPTWKALWEAKQTLRRAKDDGGELQYTTRDWAGWILTGAPE